MIHMVYLIILLFICLTPIFLFRKSAKEIVLIAISIILFVYLKRELFFGTGKVSHDTWTFRVIFSLVRQWVNYGFLPGWNPYMNAGEPAYYFSNFFLRAPFIFLAILGQLLRVSTDTLFNITWVFIFINFCTGSFLLFIALFGDFKTSFFCFLSLLLSSHFYVNLGQPSGIMVLYLFPYILFAAITSLKNKSPYGIALAIIYVGLSLNYYLPHYLFLVSSVFIMVFYLFNPEYIKVFYIIVKEHYKLILAALFIGILSGGPAIFMASELRNTIFPNRGVLRPNTTISVQKNSVDPILLRYRMLIDRIDTSTSLCGGIHHAFYFGIIPLIFIFVALLMPKYKLAGVFFITAIFTGTVSLGREAFLFSALSKYLPGFYNIRHTFGFAQFVSFLLICISGFGLKNILYTKRTKDILKVALVVVISAIALFLATLDSISHKFILLSSSVVLGSIFLLGLSKSKYQTLKIRMAFIAILAALIGDLYSLNNSLLQYKHIHPCTPAPDFGEPNPLKDYPLLRTSYAAEHTSMPPDLTPLFFKDPSITSRIEQSVFFRSIRLHNMLKAFRPLAGYERALGVNMPVIYLTNNAGISAADLDDNAYIEQIYRYFNAPESVKNQKVFFKQDEIDFNLSGTDENNISFLPIIIADKKVNLNRISILLNSPVDAFLVRLENFHQGWRAFVDGHPAKIYRANYAFQAIRLKMGMHKVTFEFKTIYPMLFWINILISVLVWIGLNLYLHHLYNLNKNI